MAFKNLLLLVAEACHSIEWEDSGDTSKADTEEAIDKVFNFYDENAEILAQIIKS